MVDRLNKPYFAGAPTFAQSIAVRGSTSAVFAGVAAINSGTSAVAVVGVDVRSESVVFLGAPMFTTNAASGLGRPLAVTSLSTAPGSGSFMITTVDSLGAGTTTRVPWMIWRSGQVNQV
jgi:hypothetical protein